MVEFKEILSYILLGLSIGIAFLGVYLWTVSNLSRSDWYFGTLGALAMLIFLTTQH